ncbi:MAG: hypothetical protein Q8910_15465, partial [Bacteroidota bacterium]|nr:hypothetical protein [Bacteroidota bacterium]
MMKKRLSCFIEQLKRICTVLFSLVIFSLFANINAFALRNCIGHELILNHFPGTIVHKASTAVASQKMSLL